MTAKPNQPLPAGHRLPGYRVLSTLARGGFSFVYLAEDDNKAQVAIKEYLPAGLSVRTGKAPTPSVSERDTATFRYGLKYFFAEGRVLASVSHPNVVRVLNFFRANKTAYMVMRYERGVTLKQRLLDGGVPLPESWLRSTFAQLLNGLREVHARKILHLDIKPANIYLREDATPVLIDFGAARSAIAGSTRSLTAVLTPGYAPLEQYSGEGKQGPWTDLYAFAGVLYRAVTNQAPPDAVSRLKSDKVASELQGLDAKYGK
jgi:serine/threonine protein kinase